MQYVEKSTDIKSRQSGEHAGTSERRSSTEAVENVGTRSEPLMTVVMKCLPDSAKSHVMHAADKHQIILN